MSDDAPLSADHVPTLTEVVELGVHGEDLPPEGLPTPAPIEDAPLAPELPIDVLPAQGLLEYAPSHAVELPAEPLATPLAQAQSEVDAQVLLGQVLAELSPRIDMMFQARLREALAPALARAADTLIRESRDEMAATLRELVQEAVTRALQRRSGL